MVTEKVRLLVSSEDESTISYLMDIFKKYNDTSKTQFVMADKDMTERNVITEKLPNASLLICLFHTLRSLRREITTENGHNCCTNSHCTRVDFQASICTK